MEKDLGSKIKEKFTKFNCKHNEENFQKPLNYETFPHCNLELEDYENFTLIKCSIVVIVYHANNKLNILLTVRSLNLRAFPGEICFPGGKFDNELDKTFIDTAIRELSEEIGLEKENLEVVCELCPIVSPASYYIVPFVCFVKHSKTSNDPFLETGNIIDSLSINKDEVEGHFSISIDYFLHNSSEKLSLIKNRFELDDSLRYLLGLIDMLKMPNLTYDRLVINFDDDLFRNKSFQVPYPFMYGVNATLLLFVSIVLDESKKLEFQINQSLVNYETIFEYLRYFRFCSYMMLRNILVEKRTSSKSKKSLKAKL
jgi:ADP-ribose pyrophosphatase YjhB (NUDIX family)